MNAHQAVFDQHPERHHVLSRDPGNSHRRALDFLKGGLKAGAIDKTEVVTELLTQHKYSLLANPSHTYYNSKGNAGVAHEGLDSSYVENLGGLEVDAGLSSRDNLVLHNSTTGETHVAYRGTTDRVSNQFFKDWKVDGEIAGGSMHTIRVQEAHTQFDRVVGNYGKNNLTVSGHSQGGHVRYKMAVRNDVQGFHYNSAININSTQVREAGRYAGNVSQ